MVRDIAKITSLKIDTVKNILNNIELKEDKISEDEILDRNFYILFF